MLKPVAYIGADPGMKGALALYAPGRAPNLLECDALHIADMPTLLYDDKVIDMTALAGLLAQWNASYDILRAAVEKVHAIPAYTNKFGKKQGISTAASFSFGFSAGALQQAFASAGIRATLVSPVTWKAVYGLCGGKENKGMSRAKASVLFPSAAHFFTRVKDDGRAEAALLAHYGSKLA